MNKKIKEFYKKAQKLHLIKKYDMAIEYYNKVLELDVNNIESLKELAELYEKINNNFNAINCYEKILYITPKNI
jgi:tetratricopeptide (TPR) repeat protein